MSVDEAPVPSGTEDDESLDSELRGRWRPTWERSRRAGPSTWSV